MRENVVNCAHDESAFPIPGIQFGQGLTKREVMATVAYHAMIMHSSDLDATREELAIEAVRYADMLIYVLNELGIGEKP